VEVQNVNLLAIQLFLAGRKAVSNVLGRIRCVSHGTDFGAKTGPAEILLCQRFLAGTEVIDWVGGSCVELDMAVFAEEIEGLLEVVADEGVADASGAEDDFGGFGVGHGDGF
jgi:hypothetical protein